jgi:Acyl-CoA dehydrogenase, C-terminal domain
MMDLSLSTDQLDLRASLDVLLAKESTPDRVRAAEPVGFDPALWEMLTGFGIPRLADSTSDAPACLSDLVVVAEAAGRHLASAPVVEAIVAARLLDRIGTVDLSGLVTFSPRPGVGGVARAVPGAAVADRVLVRHGEDLVLTRPGATVDCPKKMLSGLALAHVDLTDATVIATGSRADDAFGEALDDWRILTAAALVGLGARGLRLGVDYAKGRHQFGQSIGSFQAIQHQLADAATLVDGAELLTHEAAWASDTRSDRRHGLAAMAFRFASEAARQATDRSLHAHGGYGYTLEYDIQLYFRRAKALALVAGDLRSTIDATVSLALASVAPASAAPASAAPASAAPAERWKERV